MGEMRPRRWAGLRWPLVVAVVLGCSPKAGVGGGGGGGGGGGVCNQDLSGSWSFSGSCTPGSCIVSQTGCQLRATCNDGSLFVGTLSGSSFTGTANSAGATLTCTGALSGTRISGGCVPVTGGARSCSFAASCSGGGCGAPLSDAGGSGGGSNCGANTSCGTCTPVSGCGWCGALCRAGTRDGSNDGACSTATGDWAWLTSDCAP